MSSRRNFFTTPLGLGLAAVALLAVLLIADAARDRPPDRLAGDDRVTTATAIARHAFPDGADVVYLARQDTVSDALAAAALQDGPVALVPRCSAVDDSVEDLIADLDPTTIIALGGDAAICEALLDRRGPGDRTHRRRVADHDGDRDRPPRVPRGRLDRLPRQRGRLPRRRRRRVAHRRPPPAGPEQAAPAGRGPQRGGPARRRPGGRAGRSRGGVHRGAPRRRGGTRHRPHRRRRSLRDRRSLWPRPRASPLTSATSRGAMSSSMPSPPGR